MSGSRIRANVVEIGTDTGIASTERLLHVLHAQMDGSALAHARRRSGVARAQMKLLLSRAAARHELRLTRAEVAGVALPTRGQPSRFPPKPVNESNPHEDTQHPAQRTAHRRGRRRLHRRARPFRADRRHASFAAPSDERARLRGRTRAEDGLRAGQTRHPAELAQKESPSEKTTAASCVFLVPKLVVTRFYSLEYVTRCRETIACNVTREKHDAKDQRNQVNIHFTSHESTSRASVPLRACDDKAGSAPRHTTEEREEKGLTKGFFLGNRFHPTKGSPSFASPQTRRSYSRVPE